MIIRHNMLSHNTYNRLKRTQGKLSKNLEKLSSGYKINRAGDDAAGLSVSEKMRVLITGLSRAELNSEEGIALVNTGEGALQEVHDMLDRLKELSVQSSNGTYDDTVDRANLQAELEEICDEIDRIATTTHFNGINLFQNVGPDAEGATVDTQSQVTALTLADILSDKSNRLKNIFYTETVYNFETTPTADNDLTPGTTPLEIASYSDLAATLQTQIVPQVVTAIMEKYPAFNYLTGSSIGIGLELYDAPGSTTLASVAVGAYSSSNNGETTVSALAYQLSINIASLKDGSGNIDLSNAKIRNNLEQTIAHEMIHAFMDEATTVGMTGLTPSGKNEEEAFPDWFVEGMAQTASGPGGWTQNVSVTLDPTPSSNLSSLDSNDNASQYGTGYLACMYLGYLASGSDADMANPTAAAADIASGISNIMSQLISGEKSLNGIVTDLTGSSLADFQSNFHTDPDALGFIQKLLQYTSTADANGNFGGGLISGDLNQTNPVADDTISDLNLFALNTGTPSIKNTYPAGVTVLSGSGTTIEGTPPTQDYVPSTPITYPTNLFTVTGGTKGTDWEFDEATGTLTIKSGTNLTISGGTATADGTTYYGNIVIADNIDANLTLSGATIDAAKRPGGGNAAGIAIGQNSNVTINVSGVNTITGSGNAAGIQLSDNDAAKRSSVAIDLTSGSELTVSGDTSASYGGAAIGAARNVDAGASDITITGSGTLNATGGNGSSAIGGAYNGDIGDIEINGQGLIITATAGDHGAGIGGGWVADVTGNITITGSANIIASGVSHGTGIGSGCQGDVNTITIGSSGANNGDLIIKASGGSDGAAIGSAWNSTSTVQRVVINSGTITANGGSNGSGIGSGKDGSTCNDITINGGVITAKGSTDSAGIGSGKSGAVQTITINGGTITADGGWTNNGGNIGGYSNSSGTAKASVTITDPTKVSIKAGEDGGNVTQPGTNGLYAGEGKYVTTGTKDTNGNTLYSLNMNYISYLLKDQSTNGGSLITLTDNGTDPSSLSYPLASITVTTEGGTTTTYSWQDLQHMTENSAYLWMVGENVTLDFQDNDGTKGSVSLLFDADRGIWRATQAEIDAIEIPEEPGYVNPPNTGGGNNTPDNDPPADGAIILQVGAEQGDIFLVPRFYLCREALKLDEFDISTQATAQATIQKVDSAINRISSIRGQYGAMQNALEHTINNLNISVENLTDSESRIRDTDYAEEMMEYTKNNILIQSAQAMLSQANQTPQSVLQLMQ